MPYLATFLAGALAWNVFETKVEAQTDTGANKLLTTVIIMFVGYKLLKKL